MKVATHWAIVPHHASFWINGHLWLLGLLIEPVSDVGSSSLDNRPACFQMDILLDKFSHIKHLAIEAHPTIVGSAMLGNFVWGIVVAELIWSW